MSRVFPCMSVPEEVAKVLQCRALWLAEQWIPVNMSAATRLELYRITATVLQREQDVVLRSAASRALARAVNDFGFELEHIKPVLPVSVYQLVYCGV